METLEKITSITQRGKELRAFALPTRAVILDVLDVLTQADIDNIGRRNVPNQERLAEISRILGYQERIVSVALGKLIRLD